jgi:hypothetical protein
MTYFTIRHHCEDTGRKYTKTKVTIGKSGDSFSGRRGFRFSVRKNSCKYAGNYYGKSGLSKKEKLEIIGEIM